MNAITRIITSCSRKKCFLREVEKVLRVWIKQHNQGIRDLQSSQDIIKVMKMRGIVWVRHKAGRVEKMRKRVEWGNLQERGYFEDPGVDERKI